MACVWLFSLRSLWRWRWEIQVGWTRLDPAWRFVFTTELAGILRRQGQSVLKESGLVDSTSREGRTFLRRVCYAITSDITWLMGFAMYFAGSEWTRVNDWSSHCINFFTASHRFPSSWITNLGMVWIKWAFRPFADFTKCLTLKFPLLPHLFTAFGWLT